MPQKTYNLLPDALLDAHSHYKGCPPQRSKMLPSNNISTTLIILRRYTMYKLACQLGRAAVSLDLQTPKYFLLFSLMKKQDRSSTIAKNPHSTTSPRDRDPPSQDPMMTSTIVTKT